MNLYPEFEGKVVVMTGVSSGIGLEQAKAFLQAGAIVYGADIKESAEIKEVEQKFPTLSFQQVDIRKKKDIHMWTEKIKKELSTVDILLNTAGILDNYAPTLDTSEEQWDNIFNTNLKSMFLLTNAILPIMLKQKHGVIVNMASIAGLVTGGGGAAYTAAKHGIIGYTKQLAYDYADKGIRVNCIAPGAINTPMNAADFAGDGAMAKEVARFTPAKRWAKPKEVAEMTLYLASPRADYVHGTVFTIDGGWTVK